MQERLQKIIAAAGIASRRAAEEMILQGEVVVNGKRVTELGTKADPQRDHIKVRGKLINSQLASLEKNYLLVNKPRGYLSSVKDPKNRPLVMELVPAAIRRGLHPIGRLDFNTEGIIILTNDGELTRVVTKGGAVPKVYHAKVKGAPTEEQIKRLRQGIRVGDKHTSPSEIELIERTREGGNAWYEITLREGKNQQIRKMFDSIGHSVTKLRRVSIGHITDHALDVGRYRKLKGSEVAKFFQKKPKPARKAASHSSRKSK